MKTQKLRFQGIFFLMTAFIGGAFMGFRIRAANRKRTGSLTKKRNANILIRPIKGADPMTASFSHAVANAIRTAQVNGNPVARYDRVARRSYLEYPDGRKVYRDEA